jgi:hypothetical protein
MGWVLIYSSFIFYHKQISVLIAQNKELLKGWDSDGASRLATIFFGWLIALTYSLPWFGIYALAASLEIKRVSSRRLKDSVIISEHIAIPPQFSDCGLCVISLRIRVGVPKY